MKRLLLVLLATLTGFLTSATAVSGPVADAFAIGSTPLPLTEHLSVLEDDSGTLRVDDLLKPEMAAKFRGGFPPGEMLSLGYTRAAVWLRVTVANSSTEPLERILEVAISRFSNVQFHYPVTDGAWTRYEVVVTGYSRPFSERHYKHRYFILPVKFAANSEQTLFIRLQGPDRMEIPVRLWDVPAFREHERNDYAIHTLYLGMVIAMAGFNLLLFVTLRDRAYLLYVAFVLCVALNVFGSNGLAFEYLWPDSPQWAMKSGLIPAVAGTCFLILFMRRLLDTKTLVPRYDNWLKVVVGLQMANIAGLWFAYAHFIRPTMFFAIVTATTIMICPFLILRQNRRGAILFLAAFAVLCIAATATALRSLGMLPFNLLTTHGIKIGSAIEMLLLAFALADRYNQMRRDKEIAQHQALKAHAESLAAEQKVVEMLRESERKLEDRVARRTAQLSATVEQLKQTQAELVQAEKLASLGSLVAGVAHELNTPIGNALTTASALEGNTADFRRVVERGELRRSALDSYAQMASAMAELIVKSCQRAASLVASFKQVAVDQTSEQRRRFDLRTLVDDNIAALRPSLRGAPWEILNDVPAGITCDSYPGGLGQIITALVQNAVTHAFAGRDRGQITITAALQAQSVELAVSDDGIGMSEQVLAHVFEPFYTTQLGHGSSGLGLSIALNIATGVLGGTLTARSQPGRETRFALRFPLIAPVSAKSPDRPNPEDHR